MTCPCDKYVHPEALSIDAGLDSLPRQIAGFAEFRRDMLARLVDQEGLAGWRARGKDDLGVMLLEMWAYVCDVLAFYDEVIANESYLRTAKLRPSLRRLVGLLGHVPRPAVAASVLLAAIAEGRKPVQLPPGTAFRSEAFEDEAPQVFELETASAVHPLNNRWILNGPRRNTIGTGTGSVRLHSLLLKPETVAIKKGEPALIRVVGSHKRTWARVAEEVVPFQGEDGLSYTRVVLDRSVYFVAATKLSDIRLLRPTQETVPEDLLRENGTSKPPKETSTSTGDITLTGMGGPLDTVPPTVDTSKIQAKDKTGVAIKEPTFPQSFDQVIAPGALQASAETKGGVLLDGLYPQIRRGDYVLASRQAESEETRDYIWFEVKAALRREKKITEAVSTTFKVDKKEGTITSPALKVKVTGLKLGATVSAVEAPNGLDWKVQDISEVSLHYGLVPAGEVTVEADTTLSPLSALSISSVSDSPVEAPPVAERPRQFLVRDKNEEGVTFGGTINFADGTLDLNSGTTWKPALLTPVDLFGNVIRASRGESVVGEILGSGHASLAGQTFQLKKKPLTYVHSPTADNESGVAATLRVWVDGVRWREVATFFGAGPDDPVYVVRQTDDGETLVSFGDGQQGRRLSTGLDNVVADYRHGAGAKGPPGGSITQLAAPVKGLSSVLNPLPAVGGGDAERAEELRSNGPRSALLLGRAVSIYDFEAAAANQRGVRAARAEWRWHGARQQAVVQVWYIGEKGLESILCSKLRRIADPSVAIDVDVATSTPLDLALDVEVDSRYRESDVLSAIREVLMNAETGMLAPENIGIGEPLFRSRIFASVLAVQGARAVREIQTDGVSFTKIAIQPEPGCYFDIVDGAPKLNGGEG